MADPSESHVSKLAEEVEEPYEAAAEEAAAEAAEDAKVSPPLSSPPVSVVDEITSPPPSAPPAHAPAIQQRGIPFLGGRQDKQSVHKLLGGGRTADVLLWRDRKASGILVGGATAIWFLFRVVNYHFLTLVAHILIAGLAVSFIWSKASILINKSPPKIPEISIPEDLTVNLARALRNDINRALYVVRDIASGHDLKKFLGVIGVLWVLASIGKHFDTLTLAYIVFLVLHTVPILYEKHQDKVDEYAGKALTEAAKHYQTLNENVLSKIPRAATAAKGKKQN